MSKISCNINTYKISRDKLSKRPVGRIIETEEDFHDSRFKNIVIGYIDGLAPVLIKTNLSSEQWQLFEQGKLSKQELDKYI